MMGGVEGPATLLDRASMGVMAGPTALRLPPSQDMSGNAGRRGRAVLPPRAMPGHRAYDAVGVWDGGTVASSRMHVRHARRLPVVPQGMLQNAELPHRILLLRRGVEGDDDADGRGLPVKLDGLRPVEQRVQAVGNGGAPYADPSVMYRDAIGRPVARIRSGLLGEIA